MSDSILKNNNNNLSSAEDEKVFIEQWKRMLDLAENNSERRIKANNVYLSINTLLLGGCSYFADFQTKLLAISGILISILWFVSILNYRTTNSVRYEIIRDFEKTMKYKLITEEYRKLCNKKMYVGNALVEMIIPVVFLILFFICFFFAPAPIPSVNVK